MDQTTPPETEIRKPRRWLRRGLIAATILVLGWTAFWFAYANFLEQQADNFFLDADQEVSQQLRAGSRRISGYPFNWYLTLEQPEITNPETGARLSADVGRVGFGLPEYRNFRWQVEGNIRLRLPVPSNNSEFPVGYVTVQAARADGYFTLADTGPRDPHISLHDVVVSLGDPPRVAGSDGTGDDGTINLDQQPDPAAPDFSGPVGSITIDTIDMALLSPVWPAVKAGDPALTIEASLHNIAPNLAEDDPRLAELERRAGQALGNVINRFAFTVTLYGPLPMGVHSYALGLWRDGGGEAKLDDLAIEIGDVSLYGTGQGALDGDLQPAGSLDLTLRGHNILLDRLIAEGTVKPLMAEFFRTMLHHMITTDDAGNEVLEAKVSIQDRWFRFGNIQLIRVPSVIWAGSSR